MKNLFASRQQGTSTRLGPAPARWIPCVVLIPALALAAIAVPGEVSSAASPSGGDVLTKAEKALKAVKDLSVRLSIESLSPEGRRSRSVVSASLIRTPGLVRMEIVEPVALADQVYVIDFEKKEVRVYLPVTNQILVQSLTKAAPAGFDVSSFSLDAILQNLPSPDKSQVTLVTTEQQKGQTVYVLEAPVDPRLRGDAARSAQGATGGAGFLGLVPSAGADHVRLWINGATWLPGRVVIYDGAGKELGRVSLDDVRVNAGTPADRLRELPADAEIVEG